MNSLPSALDGFRSELELAIGREHLRTRRRRRRRLMVAALSAVTAAVAVALGLSSVLPGRGTSIVERAAAALEPGGDGVLHTKIVFRWAPIGRPAYMTSTEVWQEQRPPFASRRIDYINGADSPGLVGGHVRGGRRIAREESAQSSLAGVDPITMSVFDPRTNTIYVHRTSDPRSARSLPKRCALVGVRTNLGRCPYPFFGPGPRPGTVLVFEVKRLTDHKPWRWQVTSRVVSTEESRQIRADLYPEEFGDPFRDEIIEILKRPNVTVGGRVHFRGRDAVRITWDEGAFVYLVDAHSYDPIELRERTKRGVRTYRFVTFETLPLDAEARGLMDLRAQHAGARVNDDPSAFLRASRELTIGG